MSLQVWLPLNGDLRNQGLISLPDTSVNTFSYSNGKIGQCATGRVAWHLDNEILGNTWSVAMWVKPESLGTANNILFCKNGTSSTDCHIYFSIISTTQLNLGVNGPSSSITATGQNFTTGTWYHVAATYDGTTATIYLNGVELKHGTVTTACPTGRLNMNINGRSTNAANTGTTGNITGSFNDFRLYDHCLSAAEVKEISQGLVLHYKLDGTDTPNENLGNTSADYHNFSDGYTKAAGSWGGDAGTVTFHHSGGYAGLPYKELHKTATGTGGIYSKTADDIVLEANTTYTMSCWIKSSRNFRPIHYSFNINRGVGNVYITYGSSFDLTTEWQFFSKTFTTTEDQAGSYGEMSIIYDDDVTDYYIYYSGFKIEKGTIATRWTPPGIQYTTIQDSSGYNYNGIINSNPVISLETRRYNYSISFDGVDDCIKIPFNDIIKDKNYTVSVWTYKTSIGTKNYQTILGGPSGFELEARSSSSTSPLYRIHNWGGGTTAYEFNKWNLFTFVHTDSNSKLYVNGELKITGTSANIPTGNYYIGAWNSVTGQNYEGLMSDFRIYCTALSAADILQLYHTSAKADNLGGFHAFELSEANNGLELLAVPLTTSYGNHTNIYTEYDSNGEITMTGGGSIGSYYIPINPTGKTYYYDIEVSTDSGNVFYIGFQRYDANKTARSNDATVYISGLSGSKEARVHAHYHGTVNLSTDGVNPCAFTSLRILNDWSGANGRHAIIHKISLREVSTLQNTKINKQGQAITTELIEMNDKFRIQKNGIIEANEFIEL